CLPTIQVHDVYKWTYLCLCGDNRTNGEGATDCCQWERVECSNTTGRVIALDLSGTYSGEYWYLNASLFTPFQQLESLDLSWNNIAGCVENEGIERLSRLNNLKMLNLSYNSFNNSILSSLTHLSSLRSLNLNGNSLEGSIDVEEFDSLRDLEELDIGWNMIDKFVVSKGLSKLKSLGLSGIKLNRSILSSLSSLRELYISDVGFKGTFDVRGYRGLRKLNYLDLSGVAIRDGSKLLQSMGSFPSLNTLHLSSNNFTKTVTTTTQELHNFTNLEYLTLDDSSLHISLLQSIASLFPSLKNLSMSGCEVNGVLRGQGFPHFKSLEHLDMVFARIALNTSFLQIIGESMPSLKYLSLSDSTLGTNSSRILDQGLCSLVHLQEFRMADNDLREITQSPALTAPNFQLQSLSLSSGYGDGVTFPKFLYHQHDLEDVRLSHIKMNGEFPTWLLENNTNLGTLFLINDSLTGPFQLPIHSHRWLEFLDISNNNFRGHIPLEIGDILPSLNVFNISMNALDGSIPSSFGNMNFLQVLDLSNNQLTSEIPEHLAVGCVNLESLALSNNSLEGHMFSRNFNLTNLKWLQLEGNHFVGEIPQSLSKCSSLEGLHLNNKSLSDLSYNRLNGIIPDWVGGLSQLSHLILDHNNLEGEVPVQLCELNQLQLLDLSNNNLHSHIPPCFDNTTLHESYSNSEM
ncbi:hypothetical protein CUMW_149440, partial [Citrus unshiu]